MKSSAVDSSPRMHEYFCQTYSCEGLHSVTNWHGIGEQYLVLVMAVMCCRISDIVKVLLLLAAGDLSSLEGAYASVTASYRSCHGLRCGWTCVLLSVTRRSSLGFDPLDDVLPPRSGVHPKVVDDLAADEVPGGETPPVLTGPM